VHQEALSVHQKLFRCIRNSIGASGNSFGASETPSVHQEALSVRQKLFRCVRNSFGASGNSFGASEMTAEL